MYIAVLTKYVFVLIPSIVTMTQKSGVLTVGIILWQFWQKWSATYTSIST